MKHIFQYNTDIIAAGTNNYKDISQETIAERMGVDRQMVYFYNNGLHLTPAIIRNVSFATQFWIGSFVKVGRFVPDLIKMDEWYEPEFHVDRLWNRFVNDPRNDIGQFEKMFHLGEESIDYIANNDPRALDKGINMYFYMLTREQFNLNDVFSQGKWTYPSIDDINRDALDRIDAKVRKYRHSYREDIEIKAAQGEISMNAAEELLSELDKYAGDLDEECQS